MTIEEDQTAADLALLEVEVDLRERLRVDPNALEDEFVRCPGDLAFLASRHARAVGDLLRAKIRRKRIWGLVLLRAREELAAEAELDVGEGNKKGYGRGVTESVVAARAEQSREWRAAQEDEADAERAEVLAKGGLYAALAKKDMLVQLGANRRAELERDPVIRERSEIQRRQRD